MDIRGWLEGAAWWSDDEGNWTHDSIWPTWVEEDEAIELQQRREAIVDNAK
jgi:hypothetical protein